VKNPQAKRKEEINMKTIDRRSFALGHNHARIRNQNNIRRICIHHSVTPETHTTANFENWWRNPASGMGNPAVGGYHEVILFNGDMELNFNPTQIAHGVASQNDDSYHICVVGNFRINGAQPRAAQMTSLIERIRFNMSRFNVPIERVLGHNEFPGNASNTCPGQNMNNLRDQLRTPSVATAPDSQPSSLPNNMHRVTTRTGGFINAADAQANRNRRTWVEPGEYHIFNRANGMINVTRTPGVPGSWIDPGETPTPQPASIIRVGSSVRVNNDAQRWATGQAIPNWVRGRIYTVQQIRNNSSELLLADVISWINASDVTLV